MLKHRHHHRPGRSCGLCTQLGGARCSRSPSMPLRSFFFLLACVVLCNSIPSLVPCLHQHNASFGCSWRSFCRVCGAAAPSESAGSCMRRGVSRLIARLTYFNRAFFRYGERLVANFRFLFFKLSHRLVTTIPVRAIVSSWLPPSNMFCFTLYSSESSLTIARILLS